MRHWQAGRPASRRSVSLLRLPRKLSQAQPSCLFPFPFPFLQRVARSFSTLSNSVRKSRASVAPAPCAELLPLGCRSKSSWSRWKARRFVCFLPYLYRTSTVPFTVLPLNLLLFLLLSLQLYLLLYLLLNLH